jgi:hypothetical protein
MLIAPRILAVSAAAADHVSVRSFVLVVVCATPVTVAVVAVTSCNLAAVVAATVADGAARAKEEPAGREVTATEYTIVSADAVVPAVVAVKFVVAGDPTATEAVASTTAIVPLVIAALAGATDVRTPIDNAATATSEIRLKVVFVDMFFLSLVELRTIRTSAWAEMSPS